MSKVYRMVSSKQQFFKKKTNDRAVFSRKKDEI